MRIFQQNQYNQGIGKNKLLSSTAGVGSIITTKIGFYILVSDVNKWKFLQTINSKIDSIRQRHTDDREVYKQALDEISYNGLEYIDDFRFVKFIKSEKKLDNLVCLIGIPHMALNESFNTPNWKNHPINQVLQKNNITGNSSDFMIMGTHFPKWFKNDDGILKPISKWKAEWNSKGMVTNHFSPPRDVNAPIKNSRKQQIIRKYKDQDGVEHSIPLFKELTQTNLILICPNGHLSDLPWPNYIEWKHKKDKFELSKDDKGEYLFDNDKVGPCCSNKDRIIKWTESKTKSEGYASIFIECLSCKKKVNLEGINSIQPFCIGEKPWELEIKEVYLPKERCIKTSSCKKCSHSHQQEHMQVALVTANNVYYANGFSSLFIPMHLAENKPKELIEALNILQKKYSKYFERTAITREEYWSSKFDFNDFLIDNDINPENEGAFKIQLESEFLKISNAVEITDKHEEYRWQEYRCFSTHSTLPDIEMNKGLRFNDIQLPNELINIFKKIQQVEELKVTNVQLDFTRVKPKERIVVNGEVKESSSGQNIFSIDSKELFTLPANESLGEGLFFEFSNEHIDKWISENVVVLEDRFEKYLKELPNPNSQGLSSKMKIYNNKYKHFLIHSFSHMMMRELEFSCGYPTASLKERLYISKESSNVEKRMTGVLIYTAEGSEGSMGGLVSQGEPDKILEIIKKGLERSINCSSDPLCWESDGQGIFDLNLSACFSCSLVAETACEEMNLGLDRRVLVDEKFGYFKNI